MNIKFTNTFFDSLKILELHNKWYYKIYSFIRYDITKGFNNIFYFWNVIWKFRNWDSMYNLLILKRSLERTVKSLNTGFEVDETRIPKINDINRVCEIINNMDEDNYTDKCGELHKCNTSWELDNFFDNDLTYEQKKENLEIYKKAQELEEEELVEFVEILKNIKSWWD